jgi:hypothetical protein
VWRRSFRRLSISSKSASLPDLPKLKRSSNIEEKVAQALFVDGIFESKYCIIAGDQVNASSIAK